MTFFSSMTKERYQKAKQDWQKKGSLIICSVCEKAGGTLHKLENTGAYVHKSCVMEARRNQ